MTNIDMTAPTVAPKVGEWGMLRNGVIRGPFTKSGSDPYPFESGSGGSGGSGWAIGGEYYLNGQSQDPHSLDIIAVASSPDAFRAIAHAILCMTGEEK